ncbi:MAG: tRNA-dihydrouridine synthase family protein [Planctomycetota bacterium]
MTAVVPGLPFTSPNLLAPMEGVTDPLFREIVTALHGEDALGGTFTEFVRVVDRPVPTERLRATLGARAHERPVGLQIMGNRDEALAATTENAFEAGAPIVDVNFGCPSRNALKGCAGSALLDDPSAVERIVRAVSRAAGDRPTSAKIRAGGDDDRLLEDLARAVEAGGASLLTIHCRTRREAYADTADWRRLERAVASVSIPVCGNGGVDRHEDLELVRVRTGVRFAMIGRAALADPWVFSGATVDRARAARFLVEYFDGLVARGASEKAAAGRVKQLLRTWTAGGLADERRTEWLRENDPSVLAEELRTIAVGAPHAARVGC